jgi:Asp-tRNA(Asn)/Glu-tRNA(Gln) amidotransferase A subunit family amidase
MSPRPFLQPVARADPLQFDQAMHNELTFCTIRQLGSMLRRREVSAVELAEHFLGRLEKIGPRFNAVVTVTREFALAQARDAQRDLDSGSDRGPLHGIPYGAKDLLATAGIPTTWGAAPLKDQVFDYDATVIKKLRDAGAVLCAKLAMVELAGGMGYRQANASFTGPGLTPWSPDSWSGGSSAGSGAAVAAGLVPFAIGSETSGSIMTPASYCGVSGLRPTYGRVSRHGAMALSWTLDKLGPMAHTADDCGLVLAAIAGRDLADPSSVDQPFRYPEPANADQPLRFATIEGVVEKVQPEVRANFERALDVIRSFGRIEEVKLPEQPFGTVLTMILSAEKASAFDDFIASGQVGELTAPEDRYGGYAEQMIFAKDYIRALRMRAVLNRLFDGFLSGFDAVIAPTTITVAPPIAQTFAEYSGRFRYTQIGVASNLAGAPAISIPNGFGERNLPTALMFVGRAFHEHPLLAAANKFQQATSWHEKHPPI